MKNKVLMGLVAIAMVAVLSSCGKKPLVQIDDTSVAIEAAKTAQADVYVSAEFAAVQDSMKAINADIEAQNSKLFKKFGPAKIKLDATLAAANKAAADAAVKKEEVKKEVETTLTNVKAAIEENKTLITKAPGGKEGAAVLERIKTEMTPIEASIVEAQGLYDKGAFMDALNKVKAAKERAVAINTELKDAIAKVKGKAKPEKLSIVLNPGDLNFLDFKKASREKAPLTESASLRESSPRGYWVQGWNTPEQFFRWTVTAPAAGSYVVEALISGEPGSIIEIIGPLNRLVLTLPAGNDHWGYNWNRLRVPGALSLPEGASSITVRSPAPKGVSTNNRNNNFTQQYWPLYLNGMALLSLELATAEARKDLDQRVREFRSSTKWFGDATYGVFLQWGEWGYPQHGEKKKWPQMIDDFDVEKFAATMQEIGAGYVIWSATWRTHYFPAPIKAVDNVLPGRTSKRDLIADLISALGRRGIKLILYYHCGRGDKEWQARNWSNDDSNNWWMDPAFRKHWGDIITEVGLRYGKGLAGWLDDESEYPKPYEEIARQLKAGNPDRIISINDYVRPRLTEFEDYQFGEGFTGLNNGAGIRYPNGPERGGDGIYKKGPYKGLQAHGCFILDGPDWGVFQPETTILPPQFTNEQLTSIVEEAVARKIALSFCLLMYEDGTFSEKSLEAMRLVRKVARGK